MISLTPPKRHIHQSFFYKLTLSFLARLFASILIASTIVSFPFCNAFEYYSINLYVHASLKYGKVFNFLLNTYLL